MRGSANLLHSNEVVLPVFAGGVGFFFTRVF